MPRFHVCLPLRAGAELDLPPGAARHAQVLRLQPGDCVHLFDGSGGQWLARIIRMSGRQQVRVQVQTHEACEREAHRRVHLAPSLMAAERMDWLVEKATELGAASFTPLHSSRSSLRLSGERASKKQAHWQAVAAAACEQSGRNRLPPVHAPQTLAEVLAQPAPEGAVRWVLSLAEGAQPLQARLAALAQQQGPESGAGAAAVQLLSGPEGGLSPQEDAAARAAGWLPVTLGPRVLRAETAPLAALACLVM